MLLTRTDLMFLMIEIIIMACVLIALLGMGAYFIYRDMKQKEMEFEIKMTAAQASADSNINNLPYLELKKILDENMKYYVHQNVLMSGIINCNTDEERSLMINDLIVATCTDVDKSISVKVKNAMLNYIADKHLITYIKNTVRLLIVAEVENEIIKKNKRR